MIQKFIPENIPQEMKDTPRWVLYSVFVNSYSSRVEKLPKTINGKMADITRPETWCTYEQAYGVFSRSGGEYAGLGFVLGDGIFGIDLDHVIDGEGNIEPWAEEIVRRMDSYTEISPSGSGIHIFAKGKIPSRDRRNGSIEMYDDKRYFTVTGNCLGEARPLAERTREASAIHRQYLKRDHRETSSGGGEARFPSAGSVSDVNDLVARAGSAKNGEKFMALWKGNTAGYATQSQADQALCNILAFFSGGNRDLIDAAFRASGLMRTKWDSRRGSTTYGGITIEKAIEALGSVEQPVKAAPPFPLPVDKKDTEESRSGKEAGQTENTEASAAGEETEKKNNRPVEKRKENCISATLAEVFEKGYSGEKHDREKAKTGIEKLDKKLGGGFGSGIILLGSEPSIGKTSLLLQTAERCAEDGAQVFYLSLEQETRFLAAKVFANVLTARSGRRVTVDEVLDGKKDGDIKSLLAERAFSHLSFMDSGRIRNGETLLAEMEKLWQETKDYARKNGKPVIFYIDYLQIIPFAETSVYSIRAALDDFIRKLRQLQMRTGICVVLISSLNRTAYMGPVRMDSFKESGVIEFTGDVILGLNLRVMRSDEYSRLSDPGERNMRLEAARGRRVRELEITCLKNKYGESSFSVDVNFDTGTGVFTEMKEQ